MGKLYNIKIYTLKIYSGGEENFVAVMKIIDKSTHHRWKVSQVKIFLVLKKEYKLKKM